MRSIVHLALAGILTLTSLVAARQATDGTSASIANQYREAAERIIESALAQNDGYTKLQELCDGIGHRLSGSPQLDQAIHWLLNGQVT